MAAGLTLSTPMLELMKTPKDVLPLSSLYLRIYFLGIPGTIMYNFGAALLRAFGDTKRPMLFLTISGIVNACLNLFFVIVCSMSVDGVATATVISQYISLFLVVRCLRRSEGLSHLELKSIRLDRAQEEMAGSHSLRRCHCCGGLCHDRPLQFPDPSFHHRQSE